MAEEHTRNRLYRFARRVCKPLAVLCALLLPAVCLRADQVQMQNGDRYFGKVLSLTNDTLVLQSELLGKVNVPRSKVSSIMLGSNFVARATPATGTMATNGTAPTAGTTPTVGTAPAVGTTAIVNVQARPSFHTLTNSLPDLSALNKPNANSTDVIQEVRQQLAAAGPAAIGKFDQMVSGIMSGKLSVNDLRAEAKSAADQLRAFKREFGSDADDSLDGYLAILDNFLNDPGSTSPVPASKSAGGK